MGRSVDLSAYRYARECPSCYAYATSNEPGEERVLRNCPNCPNEVMNLIHRPGKTYMIGDEIPLPPARQIPTR